MTKPKAAKKAAPASRKNSARAAPPRRKAPVKEPDGKAAVKAYIAALPDWKQAVAKRIDAIIEREVPGVRRAIKWGMPFYGVEGKGWFVRLAAYSKHVNLRFFRGTSLKPVPPVGDDSRGNPEGDVRGLHLTHDTGLDEEQFASWVRQAAAIPGFLAE